MILFSKKAVEVSSHPRFDTKEYVRTRRGYFAECAFSYLITLTTTDTFLAKLLLNIGMDEGIIITTNFGESIYLHNNIYTMVEVVLQMARLLFSLW